MSALEDILRWQKLIEKHKLPEPKITQIRLWEMISDGKVVMIGRHAYINEASFQSIFAEKEPSNEIGGLGLLPGIPVIKNWPPEEFCKNCGWNEFVVKNYSPNFHDGDLCCTKCGVKHRDWDAG